MIFFFSYFWVATQFQPQQIAEDLEEVRRLHSRHSPRQADGRLSRFTMTRLTFAGAIFLTIIAILPQMLSHQLTCLTSRRSSSAAPAC